MAQFKELTIGGGSGGGSAIVDVAELPRATEAYTLFNGERNKISLEGEVLNITIINATSQSDITDPILSTTLPVVYALETPSVFTYEQISDFVEGMPQEEIETTLGIQFPISTRFITYFDTSTALPLNLFAGLSGILTVETTNPAEATQENTLYLVYIQGEEFNQNVFYRDKSQVAYYNNGAFHSVGISKQKVSLSDLSNLSNTPGIGGTLVSIVVNMEALNNSDFPVLDGFAMISAGALQQTAPLLEPTPGAGIVNYFSRGWVSATKSYLIQLAFDSGGAKIFNFIETDLTTAQRTEKDYSQYLTDEYFDFYIYK